MKHGFFLFARLICPAKLDKCDGKLLVEVFTSYLHLQQHAFFFAGLAAVLVAAFLATFFATGFLIAAFFAAGFFATTFFATTFFATFFFATIGGGY